MMPRRATLCSILFSSVLASALPGMQAIAATPAQLSNFFRAVQTDDARTVKSLLGTDVNPNETSPVGGEPPLVLALREGAMDVFQVLLNHPGTQLDAVAMNGNSALMMAAFKRNRPAAEALIAKGAVVDRKGWTALHYAAASGDTDIAGLLLAHGAKIDAASPPASGSYTPLMMAAREGKDEAALWLLKHGANPRLKNTEGLTAAQIAAHADHPDLARALAP
jgi:ankyrin repeat protein